MNFYITGIIFNLFAPVTFTMTFIYELDPYSLEYIGRANINFIRQGFRKILSYRQRDKQRHDQNHIPHPFGDGQNQLFVIPKIL